MSELTGHCLCKAVSWKSGGPVTRSLVCHCEHCQRATSSPFTAFIGLRPETVDWAGEVNHFESSPGCWRGFCPACGTRLYFRSEKWPGEIHIHAATLSNPKSYQPSAQVVLRSRMAWLDQLEDLPAFSSFQASPEGGGTDSGS